MAVSFEGHTHQWEVLEGLLKANHLSHGLAFVGPSGIGKRQVALALAEAAGTPKESIFSVAPAGAMLKLEQAQEILNFLSLRSPYRRFIIVDEAQQMNASFANALLKILEEPPADTHFIFLIPAMSQLLPTIRSRLQAVRFFPLSDEILAKHSKRDPWMIQAAQGSFARLEEWSLPEVTELKARAVNALVELANKRRDGLDGMAADIKERHSAEMAARLFQQFFRDALLLKQNEAGIVHADCPGALQAWSQLTKAQILQIWNEAFQLQQDIAANLDRSLSFENFYIRSRRILESEYA